MMGWATNLFATLTAQGIQLGIAATLVLVVLTPGRPTGSETVFNFFVSLLVGGLVAFAVSH
jgi:hypothetical protein